jgi:hypothetical protein
LSQPHNGALQLETIRSSGFKPLWLPFDGGLTGLGLWAIAGTARNLDTWLTGEAMKLAIAVGARALSAPD